MLFDSIKLSNNVLFKKSFSLPFPASYKSLQRLPTSIDPTLELTCDLQLRAALTDDLQQGRGFQKTNTQVKGKRYERIELSRGLGNVERVHGLLRLVEILQQILLGAVLRDTIAQSHVLGMSIPDGGHTSSIQIGLTTEALKLLQFV